MLKIDGTTESGTRLEDFAYIEGRGPLGRQAMWLTRWLRAVNVEALIPDGLEAQGRLLDIGCGDGYFLERARVRERYGLDHKMGDRPEDGLDFPDAHFDVVTMLAVIEHISEPHPLLNEIYRVLKPGGRLLLTTPKRSAEWIIALYARDIEDEHDVYYTRDTIEALAGDRFKLSDAHTFCLGLNQVFCLTKV